MDAKILPAVWSLKVKRDGSRKARLCAGGHRQDPLEAFFTYSPTVSMTSLRVVLASFGKFYKRQFDVIHIYLHAKLPKPVYMQLPEGYSLVSDSADSSRHVLRIEKSLYGLQEAGQLWYKELQSYLLTIGFSPLASDPCVFLNSERLSLLV